MHTTFLLIIIDQRTNRDIQEKNIKYQAAVEMMIPLYLHHIMYIFITKDHV